MSQKQNALDALVVYLDSHINWKNAPEGARKVEAKRARGQAHSDLLRAAELYKRQLPER